MKFTFFFSQLENYLYVGNFFKPYTNISLFIFWVLLTTINIPVTKQILWMEFCHLGTELIRNINTALLIITNKYYRQVILKLFSNIGKVHHS